MKQEVSFQNFQSFQHFLTAQSCLPDRRNTISPQALTYSQTPQTLPRAELFQSVRVSSTLHCLPDLMTPQLEGNTSGSWNYLRLIEDYPTPHMSDLHPFLPPRTFFHIPSLTFAYSRYLVGIPGSIPQNTISPWHEDCTAAGMFRASLTTNFAILLRFFQHTRPCAKVSEQC